MLTKDIGNYKVSVWPGLTNIPPDTGVGPFERFSDASWKKADIYHITAELLKLAIRVEAIEDTLERKGLSSAVHIYDLDNPKYNLKFPISVILTKEVDSFYAEAVDFDIFGVGIDEKSAIVDLKDVMISYFVNLSSSKNKLSKELKSKLKLLSNTFSLK